MQKVKKEEELYAQLYMPGTSINYFCGGKKKKVFLASLIVAMNHFVFLGHFQPNRGGLIFRLKTSDFLFIRHYLIPEQ